MGNTSRKNKIMLGVILVMFLVFIVVIVLYVVENNPNNKTAKSKIGGNDGIHYDSEEMIKKNEEILATKKVEQFAKEVKEEKVLLDTQQKNISKGEFIINTLLSILSPVIYFIITFYIAIEVEDYFIQTGARPFDLEDTWWIWTIYLIVVFLIEKKLFSIRKRSKYFKSNVFRVLFYLSTFSTIAGSVVYFLTINVQLFSRVGRSTRDGFLLQAFFFCYILPTIFWIVYYFTIKNNEAFKSFLDKKKQKRSKESKVLKRGQAIKELKEAKELLDLGILSKEEYNELSKKLKPFILGTKP